MLTLLRINNFAIIDEVEISFKSGFTVITGETGAGKSVIVDALDFLLGSRITIDVIKSGKSKATVEGLFLTENLYKQKLFKDWISENGFENLESATLSVSRELTKDGSRVRINGNLANVSHLFFLREYLIDIHEQSKHFELIKPEKQQQILDSLGDFSHRETLEQYKTMFSEYQELDKKLKILKDNSESITKKNDLLRFQINEITTASISDVNEEEKLKEKREILLNKKELLENANLIYEQINGENESSVLSSFVQIKKLINRSSEFDGKFKQYLEQIEDIIQQVKDLSSFVRHYSEDICNDNELQEIEERLDLLYSLKRKYGKSLEELKIYLSELEEELSQIDDLEHGFPKLEKLFFQKQKETVFCADKLTVSREKIAKEFVNEINKELLKMGFPVPLLAIEFISCDLSVFGKEQIQILFTANPDEPPKPLLKVASGGELSRIMLAIKMFGSKNCSSLYLKTMLFDEIDMGVSGNIASNVGKCLFDISKSNQVLCITHQPIIAAIADRHLEVEKKISDGMTHVSLKEVAKDQRIDAIAALLTPDKKLKDGITEDARVFAKSLLENAEKLKFEKKQVLAN